MHPSLIVCEVNTVVVLGIRRHCKTTVIVAVLHSGQWGPFSSLLLASRVESALALALFS